jgi:hypothetical protein
VISISRTRDICRPRHPPARRKLITYKDAPLANRNITAEAEVVNDESSHQYLHISIYRCPARQMRFFLISRASYMSKSRKIVAICSNFEAIIVRPLFSIQNRLIFGLTLLPIHPGAPGVILISHDSLALLVTIKRA